LTPTDSGRLVPVASSLEVFLAAAGPPLDGGRLAAWDSNGCLDFRLSASSSS
jgi:hypothetical protein